MNMIGVVTLLIIRLVGVVAANGPLAGAKGGQRSNGWELPLGATGTDRQPTMHRDRTRKEPVANQQSAGCEPAANPLRTCRQPGANPQRSCIQGAANLQGTGSEPRPGGTQGRSWIIKVRDCQSSTGRLLAGTADSWFS
jgi:hypothetical protein